MNYEIETQIINMITFAKNFEQTCQIMAVRDDERITPEEKRTLKKITACTEEYIKKLDKLRK